MEQAIELNGTAVAANRQAFRRGRQLIADPDALRATLSVPTPAPRPHNAVAARVRALVTAEPGSELARLLDIRVPDLIEYADERYARQYAEFVEHVRVLENGPTTIAETVARYLHKLMAYKDEYEVARLSLDEGLRMDIEARFGVGTQFRYRLHPPVLRALGMRGKISLGPWFRPVFALLYGMRRLRGTALDPFGRAEVRRAERQLVVEYRDAILRSFATGLGHADILALAGLPDLVRGYEQIKLANVAQYRAEQAALLGGEPTPAQPVVDAIAS